MKKSFLDPAAFPCLAYAAQVEGIESVPLGDVPEEDLGLALPDKIVVGSIPVDFPVGSKLVSKILTWSPHPLFSRFSALPLAGGL